MTRRSCLTGHALIISLKSFLCPEGTLMVSAWTDRGKQRSRKQDSLLFKFNYTFRWRLMHITATLLARSFTRMETRGLKNYYANIQQKINKRVPLMKSLSRAYDFFTSKRLLSKASKHQQSSCGNRVDGSCCHSLCASFVNEMRSKSERKWKIRKQLLLHANLIQIEKIRYVRYKVAENSFPILGVSILYHFAFTSKPLQLTISKLAS